MQLWLFTKRAFIQLRRDLPTVTRNYTSLFIAALLLGTLNANVRTKANFPDPRPIMEAEEVGIPITEERLFEYRNHIRSLSAAMVQAYTLGMLAISIAGVQSALDYFGAEREVYFREFRVRPNVLAYMLGKQIASFPLTILYPYVFLTTFYSVIIPYGSFRSWYWPLLALQFAAEGLSHFISVVVTSNRQVTGGLSALVFCMFSGAFPPATRIPSSVVWISNTSFARYAMELLLLVDFQVLYHPPVNHTITDDLTPLQVEIETQKWAAMKNVSQTVLEQRMAAFEYSLPTDPEDPFATDAATAAFQGLFLLGCFWRFLTFLALTLLDRQKRR